MQDSDFSEVTELAGTEISREQLDRMSHRYHWAARFAEGKDVVEVACGSGQGLGILSKVSKSIEAGDYSAKILAISQAHFAGRVPLQRVDAQALPYGDASKDVVILFEAIYYLADASKFVRECKRVLRPGGCVLIATANKDLRDFNPSPHSYVYYGAQELNSLFSQEGFRVEVFGHFPVSAVSWRQKMLRPVKTMAVSLGLIPKTMTGKKLLKKLVFGRLIQMPAELAFNPSFGAVATPLRTDAADSVHKVLYARAVLST